jgi:hypothetical protein
LLVPLIHLLAVVSYIFLWIGGAIFLLSTGKPSGEKMINPYG